MSLQLDFAQRRPPSPRVSVIGIHVSLRLDLPGLRGGATLRV